MKQVAYYLFETSLGWCGIAWRGRDDFQAPAVVTLFQFPEATTKETESRIIQKTGVGAPAAPLRRIVEIVEKVCKHLRGEVQDFGDVAVDPEGASPFARRVYEAARQIPAGQTRTYGELARTLGRPGAARAVGGALGRNPIGLIIPCHRVVAVGGKAGGFSAYGGWATKTRLLAIEGARW